MQDSDRLQEISFPIESAVCLLDREREFKLTDSQAIDIFEALLDMYAFGCSKEILSDRIRDLGCETVFEIVEKELQRYIREDIIRILGAVRFVARRRACGGRHHLEVLHRYCGSFLESGVGLRIMENGQEVACNI